MDFVQDWLQAPWPLQAWTVCIVALNTAALVFLREEVLTRWIAVGWAATLGLAAWLRLHEHVSQGAWVAHAAIWTPFLFLLIHANPEMRFDRRSHIYLVVFLIGNLVTLGLAWPHVYNFMRERNFWVV
ncbi:hypothetical protein [Parvibaculum sp. MBR-TMA-1.3b-4.2]